MSHVREEIIQKCKNSGMRRTEALVQLMDAFLSTNSPMTLKQLAAHPKLNKKCDPATIFRLLQRLSDRGLVRKLGLHERAGYYLLLLEDQHQDFLICFECGKIEPIQAPCPVHQLEKDIAASTGFTKLYHELEFFGVCPECA